MKSILKQIIAASKKEEATEAAARQAELNNPHTQDNRRNFFKKTALGGISLAGFMSMSIEDTVAQTTSKVSRASNPSELKITDMRYAVIQGLDRNPIIRIDTNQGIYGLGEVLDFADERYALMLKSRLLGQNPCNVEMLFKTMKQFGANGRQGGGVSGVEMALWDLCGKAYGVPVWQLLGGRYRDKVRLYADTPGDRDISVFREKIRTRMQDQGFTWLKMDLGIQMVAKNAGTTVNTKFWNDAQGQYDMREYMGYGNAKHPFTQIQITDKGLNELAKYVDTIRSVVGYEVPLCADHFGHFDLNNAIRLGKAVEKYRLAWLEDLVAWMYTDQWKTITNALETPTLTGEDIYSKENFKPLIDAQAIDIVHPDLGAAGGILETKKIGDYAEEHGIAMAMHQAGSPVNLMANVHCAAATQGFLALEHHSADVAHWENLVRTTDGRPLITKGFANVPLTAPGLGIELNEEEVKKHLIQTDKSYFRPTPEWNDKRSHDRLWS
ncbi:mandelate racemase/muconate lactonizing enzyme family protein [Adhaeribacter aquaticus]|uniref:mandelate racemase/muconate lactonizing enzyme family protein n=1 Tax=Adhaeribacter aquaticus TaxID=299567 RepID=UPI0004197BF6|nr:mandelate racemase/muconate lactonizing enzyme family protein [Adhaeribacter aquaticus]